MDWQDNLGRVVSLEDFSIKSKLIIPEQVQKHGLRHVLNTKIKLIKCWLFRCQLDARQQIRHLKTLTSSLNLTITRLLRKLAVPNNTDVILGMTLLFFDLTRHRQYDGLLTLVW